MALVLRSFRFALATPFIAGIVGCSTAGSGTQLARDENRKMDTFTRCAEELEQEASRPILVVRSQTPETLPPVRLGTPMPPTAPIPLESPTPAGDIRIPELKGPVTPAGGTETAPPLTATPGMDPTLSVPRLEGDAQVRIVASIGNNPIYESEVREAVYQRMGEFMRYTQSQRQAKERDIFREELRKIIERELVVDEMIATLTAKKQTTMLNKLRETAGKEADTRLKEFKKDRGIPTDAEFRSVLRSQGLTLSGIRRQIERSFMMQTYLREKLTPMMDKVSLSDLREYYSAHASDFRAEDAVKWQDLYVEKEQFKTADGARQFATSLSNRAAKGEDFIKLVADHGMGDTKLRNGAGVGEKPGEIFPQELEPAILSLKAGQVTIKETETGYHILRVAERSYAGTQPYTEKLQGEIRRRLQNEIFEREAKRFIDTIWKRSQPQIWADK
ncbi:MAG: hypothetical protein EXS09_16275 [Gemmataceae bacterium]|nr:hypothetical protein [Gemmataceae bacterium]